MIKEFEMTQEQLDTLREGRQILHSGGNEMSKELTWEDLANLYDAEGTRSRPARTLPMGTIFDWAERQTDRFFVDESGSIHLKEESV